MSSLEHYPQMRFSMPQVGGGLVRNVVLAPQTLTSVDHSSFSSYSMYLIGIQ